MKRWLHRMWLVPALLALLIGACAHSRSIQLLDRAPTLAHRTVGMVSGQGDNDNSALDHLMSQVEQMEADAVVVVRQRRVGRSVIVTGRVIRYLQPPPEQ